MTRGVPDAIATATIADSLKIGVRKSIFGLVEPLTDREHEVLWLEDIGLSNPEIAARLNRSEETVKKHITNMYSKLGVKTRAEALARGHELGLL